MTRPITSETHRTATDCFKRSSLLGHMILLSSVLTPFQKLPFGASVFAESPIVCLLIIEEDTLIPPFVAVPGLGENVAKRIVEAREEGPFLSKEDLNKKAGLSQKVIDYLDEMGSLPGLPDKAQLSIFDM